MIDVATASEARYVLRKLLSHSAAEVVLSHAWVSESDRWRELVFALLTQIEGLTENRVRHITTLLSDMGLLDVEALASIADASEQSGSENDLKRHIVQILEENGMTPEGARRGLTAIAEAADGLQKHHDGKVQRYLRRIGESVLHQVDETFSFSTLEKDDVQTAFTYWLQNTVSMPLSLIDGNMEFLCDQYGMTPSDLIGAADQLDLNVALLDDLIQSYLAAQESDAGG